MSSTTPEAKAPAPEPKAPATNRVGLSVKEYGGSKSTLCVGCGHDVITRQITQALYEMSIPPFKVAKLSGIGCSSKTTAYFADRGHGFNAVHGRMPAVATGALMVNSSLVGVGVSGDGDTASIGAGQFVHLLRRNLPMVYIVENNGVYGLTKGQFSATADAGSRLKTGVVNDLPAIDLCAMAIELGCGYVARSFSGDMKQLVALLKGALAHRGTALLDVISPCVTFNNHESSTKSYKWAKDHEIPIHEIGFIPYFEEIAVEYDPGTTQDVELHDGSHIRLRKLREDYDPTDKGKALALCQEAQEKTEFLTGLIYAEPRKKDFLELSGVGGDPIVTIPDARLRPPKKALDEITEALK
ncbi:MAG TPA: 2-oxoacid:ferredoxin oxidoreductase subunit beta [Thermoanaerobaculia bacterium]|nr:2-oxoacid:ferredoxin oxidoreductase subunit beta [Thermoanaerobaculia bacterium]